MAKKLNTKVAIIGISLLALMIAAGGSLFIYRHIKRDPDRALRLYQQARQANDYEEAETQLRLAYAYGKSKEDKIQRLFELADFHLIQNEQHEADWLKALQCWNTVINTDTQNIQARRALLDFYYQGADAGDARMWRSVNENTKELLTVLKDQGADPDTSLLKAHARSLLAIAERGGTTNRKEMLDESVNVLSELIEKEPQHEEYYKLLADAAVVEGELNAQSGVIDAVNKAQEKGLSFLETAVEQTDDKATAVADLILYKMRTLRDDPNTLEAIRAELEDRSQQVQPNDKLYFVTSIVYETPGKMSPEAALNRAIESIRQARELKPESFEYALRMSQLMYRKGNVFNDPAAVEDALQIAEKALSLSDVQDVPGPLQGRNLNYRFVLNNYLANLYLEKALAAREAGRDAERDNYTQRAETRIKEILDTLGTAENPIAQKYKGMLALVKGEREEAIPLLYKAYQQNKALDVAGEASKVDSRVCVVLAKIAGEEGQLGLQTEFLQGAFNSQDRYIQQKPQLFLDYAELINKLRNFRGWANAVMTFVNAYESRSGVNDQSRKLAIQASIALGQIDKAKELLAYFETNPQVKLDYEFRIVLYQVAQLKQAAIALEGKGKELTAEQAQELETLRVKQNTLLDEYLSNYPKELDPQFLNVVCIDLIRNDNAPLAIQYLDTYLSANPDAFNLKVLRLQAQQKDPMNLTPEEQSVLRDQAIESVGDAKQKAMLLAERYGAEGDYEKALESIEGNSAVDADDPDIVQLRFNLVLEQKDIPAAEKLQQVIRSRNLDMCDGNLAAARLEILKENYELALRRLDECLTLNPLSGYTYFLKSEVQRQLQDRAGAIESAKTAFRMDPQRAVFARQLASLLLSRDAELGNKVTSEQRMETQQALQLARALNPSDWQLQSLYAETIFLNSPDQALDLRQQLLKSNPTVTNALMLGNMAVRMAQAEWDSAKKTGLFELAEKAYQQGMEIDPNDEMLRQTYADFQQQTGKTIDPTEWFGDDRNLEWKFYLRNGQFEKAETLLKELLEKSPEDLLLVRGLVVTSQALGHREDLKQYIDMLSRLDDTKETEVWILQKYVDNGFSAEAEKKLASFRERYPDEKTALLVEAWIEMGKGRLEQSLSLTNRYLETETNNAGAWRLRGRLFRLMNQPRKAVDDLQRSKNLLDTPEVRMELAIVYTEINQMTAAVGELVAGIENPQTPLRNLMMLEKLYQKNSRTGDLEKFYAAMINKTPDSSFWYLRAGAYYLGRTEYSKAEGFLKKALDLSIQNNQLNSEALQFYLRSLYASEQYDKTVSAASGFVDGPFAYVAYEYIAQVQAHLNQTGKAVESFYRALDKAGTNDAVLTGVAQLMVSTVGQDKVDAWIDEKLKADAASLPAHLLAANMAQMQEAYNKAIDEIQQCINSVDKNSSEWLLYNFKKINFLIMGYAKTLDQDYFNRAVDLLNQMVQLQPNNPSLLNNLAYLLVDNDQQLEMALEYARKALQSDPGNAIYLDTYAYAQCKNGLYEQAEQNVLRSIQIYDVSGQSIPLDLYKHYAMVKEGLGQTDAAIEMYQKAIDAAESAPEKEKQQLQEAIKRLQQSKEN